MKAPFKKSLFAGGQLKDTEISHSPMSDFQIINCLNRLPSLFFSENGLENLSKRFGISESHLLQLISSAKKDQE